MYELKENQMIVAGKGVTYYYLVNSEGKTIDKRTLKPYRGKDLKRYSMRYLSGAKAYLETINQ